MGVVRDRGSCLDSRTGGCPRARARQGNTDQLHPGARGNGRKVGGCVEGTTRVQGSGNQVDRGARPGWWKRRRTVASSLARAASLSELRIGEGAEKCALSFER